MTHHVADAIDQIHAIAAASPRFYAIELDDWGDDSAPMTDDDIRDLYYDDNEHVFAMSVFDPNWGVWRDA